MKPEQNVPTVFIVLGATGDLMRRKIAPTLYHMHERGNLPEKFRLVGVARKEMSDEEYHELLGEQIKRRVRPKQKSLVAFLKHASYLPGTFEDKQTYTTLKKTIAEIDSAWGLCSNKLFYLAVPPHSYEVIFKHLAKTRLTEPCSPEEGWTRVIVEKPFGNNLRTARRLERLLANLFRETQIYRIDHYLGKEMIQNILTFRFSNTLFEKIWNKEFIEKIEIRLFEKIGVEDRGTYYDNIGALRDMGQNHILQMLAFITMEHPESFSPDAIRFKRAEVLKALRAPTRTEIKRQTYRAQYKGYRNIEGVTPDSETETYFKIGGAFLSAPRWEGVPIVLESGKRLSKQEKQVIVTLKHPTPCLCPPGTEHYKNRIVFSLEPTESIDIEFWSKKPGLTFDIEGSTLQFHLRKNKKSSQYVEEYEKLLLDVIAGDQTLFITTDEVEAMWNFTDPIVAAWKQGAAPLHTYKPNSMEPVKNAAYIDDILTSSLIFNLPAIEIEKMIGIVGLGKMGGNIARQLLRKNWRVIAFDKNTAARDELERDGAETVSSLRSLVAQLPTKPRIVLTMVPAGKATKSTVEKLAGYMEKGDIIIDGGNSYYKDSIKLAKRLKQKGIHFIDVGISGGPEGALTGAALMVGGSRRIFKKIEPLFADLAYKETGYQFFEGAGAGHFVKMVHNGIEYGMMQAIAEGFTILKKAKYKLDLAKVADVYNKGAVIESRLIGWLKSAFEVHSEELKDVSGKVPRGGTGDWTVQTAKEERVKARVIEESVKFRKLSERKPNYTGKILNALREQFGGHHISK